MDLKTCILRYWRGKGFGIHSPFAFSFVTEIAHCKYAYYAYEEIAHYATNATSLHDAKLIHRIIARFHISNVVLHKDAKPIFHVAAKSADSRLQTFSYPQTDNHQLFYIDKTTIIDEQTLNNSLNGNMNFLLFRGIRRDADLRNLYQRLSQKLKNGVILEDTDFALIISNKKMPQMKYDVKL